MTTKYAVEQIDGKWYAYEETYWWGVLVSKKKLTRSLLTHIKHTSFESDMTWFLFEHNAVDAINNLKSSIVEEQSRQTNKYYV